MAGIISYGAYIPYARIERGVYSKFWGGFAMPGERTAASFDEDSLTMAVESAIDCMTGTDPRTVDGLFFATTTAPYKLRLCSSIISVALDMREDIRTMDVTGALRAGTTAMAAAVDAIKGGSMKRVLVTVGETMMGAPGSLYEQAYGDGAAAILLGDEGVIASIEGQYCISDDFAGIWRTDDDQYLRTWEDRMVLDQGYSDIMPKAILGLMKKYNLAASDISAIVYDAPHDPRRHLEVAARIGLHSVRVQDSLFLDVGNTGSALALMMLVAALEESHAGDKIILASYGNGADAFLLQVTPEIEKARNRRGIKHHLSSKRMIGSYGTYVRWRQLIPLYQSSGAGFHGQTSIACQKREHKVILGLWGVKCRVCGTPQYNQGGSTTPARICVKCQAKDQFDDYRFAGKRGKVFSFTQDNLADHPDPPLTMTIVDFEGGGRALFEMTDRDSKNIEVGMPVELAFRKMSSEGGVHNYFWKTRLIRC